MYSPSTLKFKLFARSFKCAFNRFAFFCNYECTNMVTVGGTVCTCIRFCTQTDMFPLPPVRVRSVSRGKFSPPTLLESCIYVQKYASAALLLLRKLESAPHIESHVQKYLSGLARKFTLFFFFFKGVVSSDSELFNSLKIQPIP
jgi:hypothetical protein